MYPNRTMPCVICKEKNYNPELDRLKKLQTLVNTHVTKVDFDNAQYHYLMDFHVHSRCRYGLSCPHLKHSDTKANTIAQDISDKLIQLAINGGPAYHTALRLCQGFFPNIYSNLNCIRRQTEHAM